MCAMTLVAGARSGYTHREGRDECLKNKDEARPEKCRVYETMRVLIWQAISEFRIDNKK